MTRQRITRLLSLPVVAAVIAAGLGMAPATAAEPVPMSPTVSSASLSQTADQDGRDLYRAIYFFQGGMADELMASGVLTADAEVVKFNRSAEGEELIRSVLDTMAESDPAFFATFSQQLRSGDPFQVEDGLQAGTDMLLEVAPTIVPGDHASAAIVMAVVLVAVAAVLVVSVGAVYSMTYGGMIHHTVAINQTAVFAPIQVMGGRGLDVERHVADITRALATVGMGAKS